jgi:hypothetical protein
MKRTTCKTPQVRLDEDVAAWIQQQADVDRRSLNQMANLLIRRMMRTLHEKKVEDQMDQFLP